MLMTRTADGDDTLEGIMDNQGYAYIEQFTPCQHWLSQWVSQFRKTPEDAWGLFESAHRTAFIILRATRPETNDEGVVTNK